MANRFPLQRKWQNTPGRLFHRLREHRFQIGRTTSARQIGMMNGFANSFAAAEPKKTATSTRSFMCSRNVLLQRKCACGGKSTTSAECEGCRNERLPRPIRTWRTENEGQSFVPPIVHEVLRSGGQSLNSSTRDFMEQRFDHDFSHVRVHADARAGESAQAVGADAYTVGRQIVFAPGRYAPRSVEGQELMAHELVHVIQQEQSANDTARLVTATASAEREAEKTAAKVLAAPAQVNLSRTSVNLAKAPQGGGGSGTKPKTDPVEQARAAASIRVLLARDRVTGLGPPSPLAPSSGPLAPSPMAGQPYPD